MNLVSPEMDPFKDPRGNRLLQVDEDSDEEPSEQSAMDITAEEGDQTWPQVSGTGEGSSMDISHD
jgi:hypothetical protein